MLKSMVTLSPPLAVALNDMMTLSTLILFCSAAALASVEHDAYLHRPVESEAEFADAYAASMAAALARGVQVSSAVEYKRGRYGAAYFATAEIADRSELIVVPAEVSLEYGDVRRRFDDLEAWAPFVQPNGDRSLYSLLLALPDHETRLRPLVVWMSPRACVNSVTFAGKVLRDRRLTSDLLRQLGAALGKRAHQDYALLRRYAPQHLGNVSRADFRLAYCWFETRSFGPRPDAADGSATLMPIADLPNHSPSINMAWYYDTARRVWVFYAVRDIEPGEELVISYGEDKTSEMLLISYGFATRDNLNDVFNLPVTAPVFAPHTHWLQLTRDEPHFRRDDAWLRVEQAAAHNLNATLLAVGRACADKIAAIEQFIANCNDALRTNTDPSPQVPATLHAFLSYYDAELATFQLGCDAVKKALWM